MKKILSLVLAAILTLSLSPAAFAAEEELAPVDKITLSFTKDGQDYTVTFTNIGNLVATETDSNGQAYPYCLFYYPETTVTFSESLDNTHELTNGFFLETDYHFGEDGKITADTTYSVSDVFKKLVTILNGSDSGDLGTLGAGPMFLIPWTSAEETLSFYSGSVNSIHTFEKSGATADSPSDWAVTEVTAAIDAGLVPESLQSNYTGNVTRGQVAEMFIRLVEECAGMDIQGFLQQQGVTIDPNVFSDTSDEFVLAANALGIINGVGEGRFSPNGTFTRAQIAVIINRTADVLGVETAGFSHDFVDMAGHWADSELGWPVHAGVINGVGEGRFNPDGPLTTEQAIVIAYRALQAL